MPSKDFILVQPRGIALLMTPAGLVTYWTGTAWGLAIGRISRCWPVGRVALAGLVCAPAACWRSC